MLDTVFHFQSDPILGKGRDCDGSDKVVIETRVLGLKMEGEETNWSICANHPVDRGSSLEHSVYVFSIYAVEIDALYVLELW